MSEPKLQGIFTPHMVPLDDHGRIDEAELRRLIEFLIVRGVHGLYPNGSTGEFTRFTFEERKEIVRIVTEQAAGRVTIMAGAAEANVEQTLEACDYYAELGCDCVAIVPPFYYKLSQAAVREYFDTIARRSPIDITLYNIPQFSNPISLATLKRLVERPRIIGIKDSSRDFPSYLNTMNEIRPLRPDFSFLIGCEEILVPSIWMGGNGGTVATSGVVPELVVEMYDATVKGEQARAIRLQYALLRLIDVLIFGVGFPEGIRTALELRGFSMGRGRMPLGEEELVDVAAVRSALREMLDDLGCQLEVDGRMPVACRGPRLNAGGAAADEPGSGSPAFSTPGLDDDLVRRVVARVMEGLGGDCGCPRER